MTPRPATRRRYLHRAAAAVVAVATAGLVLAACATHSGGPQQAQQPVPHPRPAGPPAATLTTLAGKAVRVPGSKPTAVFFFSVGCGECAEGAKSFAKAATTVGGKAEFLAVDIDPHDSADAITGFLRSIGSPDLPAAIDKDAVLSRTYQVSAISTLIVVDPAGKVTFRATDPPTDKIEATLTAAGAK
ncbi:TlpA disulfide reductase family protein [Mycobacterium sp.]|uniref:TlpA family protein disulfide reductase n=1 Tax=Mycobacterium sp. TaxID=1785 RepID=UPI0031E3DC21